MTLLALSGCRGGRQMRGSQEMRDAAIAPNPAEVMAFGRADDANRAATGPPRNLAYRADWQQRYADVLPERRR